jgi:formate/nitrite transporter FocA (FNT family)
METVLDQVESFIAKASDLAETKAELIKLRATGKLSQKTSSLVGTAIIVSVAGMALLLLSTGAAIWIGDALRDIKSGFFIVGGLYVLGALLLLIFRKSLLTEPLTNLFIGKIYK